MTCSFCWKSKRQCFYQIIQCRKSWFFFLNFRHTGEFGRKSWCGGLKFFFYLFNIKHLFKIFKTCSHNILSTQLMISNKQSQFMQNIFQIKNQKMKKNRPNVVEQRKDLFCFRNCTSKLAIFAFHSSVSFQIWLKIQFQKKMI